MKQIMEIGTCHLGGSALQAKGVQRTTSSILHWGYFFRTTRFTKRSKLSSKFEELATGSAKATITDGTLFDNYFRSSLSVSSLVVCVERRTSSNEIIYTHGESRELLGI